MTPAEVRILLSICLEAAEVVRAVYARPFEVEYKGPDDPVTEADRCANELICARLEASFPGTPVVAEESSPDRFAEFRRYDRIFFVDPVDGTREFVARNGEFAVMIGVVEGRDAVASVISAPATGASWVGLVGHGAFNVDPTGAERPIHVSSTTALSEALLVASRSHRTASLERVLTTMAVQEIRAVGSAGLKGARVATGAADIYVSPHYAGKRWDVCPSDALVTAAGGRVTDARGEKIDYRADSLVNDLGVLVTNGILHDVVLERLARVRALEAAR